MKYPVQCASLIDTLHYVYAGFQQTGVGTDCGEGHQPFGGWGDEGV